MYARINPKVKLPKLDCELAAFEKATREFLEEYAVRKKLDNVRLKLMKIAEADEPEPEQ